MANVPSGNRSPSILRLRAGLLLLLLSVILCGSGGHFVARQFGLGLGWSILLAIAIWVGVGVLLARIGSPIYFVVSALVTGLLAYLVYDFTTSAIGWSSTTAIILAVLATALVAFTFYDFGRLKVELRRWAYRR